MKRLLFALTALGVALAPAALSAGTSDGRLDVYWIDVEGGAATLIVTPVGESVLIDSGNPGHRDPDRIVHVATRVAGVRRIDHLITTHYHRDHYGGASTLATMIPIGTVYDNGKFDGMPDNPGKDYFSFKSDRRVVVQPGDTIPLKKGDSGRNVRLKCLGARKQFIDPTGDEPENASVCAEHRPKDRDGSDNANSIVMVLDFGPFRFYDGGDLTWNQEMKLVCPVNLVGKVDVYQVTHHGLDSSNNPIVLKTLEPTVAIMNNGVTKGCMPEVFANLKETGSLSAIYQLHKNLRPDGRVNNVPDSFIANTAETCEGNHVKLSVAPDGLSYEVAIPANDHRQTYKTRMGK